MIKRLLVVVLVAVLYWVHPFSLPLSAFSRPTCSCIRIEKRNLTLTTLIPGKQMLIQRYSERGHLLWEDRLNDVFSND